MGSMSVVQLVERLIDDWRRVEVEVNKKRKTCRHLGV